MNRSAARELRVGLVVLVGLTALLSLLVLARVGPGFLGPRRSLDVIFKDGQGIRVGCPVRVAGVDAGRVLAVRLVQTDDGLRVRLTLTLPARPVRVKASRRTTSTRNIPAGTTVSALPPRGPRPTGPPVIAPSASAGGIGCRPNASQIASSDGQKPVLGAISAAR